MRADYKKNPPVRSVRDQSGIDDVVTLDLSGAEGPAAAVTEIYRYWREGSKIIAFTGGVDGGVDGGAAAVADEALIVGLNARTLNSPDEAAARRELQQCDVAVAPGGARSATPTARRERSGGGLRVGVAGLGLIGEGVGLRLGEENSGFALCAALVREPFRDREHLRVDQLTNDLSAFLAAKPDVVIDALPSGPAGNALIRAALERGVSVVTANKQAIAGSMRTFTDLAAASGAAFRYSASVGGGAPFVETIARARRIGDIRSLEAVLNGTVNFILTALSKGDRFDAAILVAQKAGFAEPDPSADLSGADARAKLAIVSFEAFGVEIDLGRIDVEALDAETAARFVREGGSWKQIARLSRDASGELAASVRFERRDGDELFAGAQGESNALRIVLDDGRRIECRGKGAGRRPTVESILGDLGAIRRDRLKAAAANSAITPEPVLA